MSHYALPALTPVYAMEYGMWAFLFLPGVHTEQLPYVKGYVLLNFDGGLFLRKGLG